MDDKKLPEGVTVYRGRWSSIISINDIVFATTFPNDRDEERILLLIRDLMVAQARIKELETKYPE